MPRISRFVAGGIVAGVLGLCGAAQATVLASEDFSYADGALAGNNGGIGWAGAWVHGSSAPGQVADGAAALQAGRSFRSFDTPISTAAGNRIYIGFDLRLANTVNPGFLGLSFFSGSQEALFLGADGSFRLAAGGSVTSAAPLPVSDTHSYIVAEIVFLASQTFSVNMYLEPVGTTLGTAYASCTACASRGASWDRIRLAAGAYTSDEPRPIATYDNLVIGTELADVMQVPEPSTLALLAVAALGLVHKRRPRKGAK